MQDNDPRLINSQLNSSMDHKWTERIIDAFTPKDKSIVSVEMGQRILAAINHNIRIGSEIRSMLIDEVQLIDEESSRTMYNELNRSGITFEEAKERSGLIAIQDHDHVIYPAFQFEQTEEAFTILQAVQSKFVDEKNGWAVLSWWTSGNAQLNWDIPKEVYATNPPRLIRTLWK